jgi:biopolymer transport protein TolR
MIGGNAGGGSSRRRSLDADINLVPFIDLLSMCICFLLMTAVWTQIGSLPVRQSHGTDAAAPTRDQYQLEIRYLGANSVETQLRRNGKAVERMVSEGADAPALARVFGQALASKLRAMGGDGATLVSSAMLTPRTEVPYGDLVILMDALRRQGVGNIGVVPVEASRYAAR